MPNKTTDYDLFEHNKEVHSIADATVATIRGFYVENTPVLSISRASTNLLSSQKQSEILNRVLRSTSTEIAYTVEEPHCFSQVVRVYNVFFIDGFDGFRYARDLFYSIHTLLEPRANDSNLQTNFEQNFC